MVIPLSFSSSLVSMYLASPADLEAIIPALATKESDKVDFPWSTWAMTDMFLMFPGLSMISLIYSILKLTIFKE